MKLASSTNEASVAETVSIDETHEATTVQDHGSEDQGVLANLGLNGQLFAIQLVNFVIVIAILWFLILRPLVRVLEERKKIVDESIVNAKKVETEVQETNKRYQQKMEEATVKANAVVAKAQTDAEVVAKEVSAKAKKEVAGFIEKGKQTIESERDKMLEEVKKDVVEMVIESTEKVLQGAIDEKLDEKWLNKQLAKTDK